MNVLVAGYPKGIPMRSSAASDGAKKLGELFGDGD
jgi:hypothetical protein